MGSNAGDELCPHCGAKMVEYCHALSQPLVKSLMVLAERGGGPLNLKELDLTYNQRCNFQKLRYFDLVEQSFRDGERLNGVWEITDTGWSFLAGQRTVHSHVWTYRAEVTRFEGEQVHASDLLPGYQPREEWAADAQPHSDPTPSRRRITRTPQQRAEVVPAATRGQMQVKSAAEDVTPSKSGTRSASSTRGSSAVDSDAIKRRVEQQRARKAERAASSA